MVLDLSGSRACILAAMGRKRIIAFAVAVIIAVMMGALIYEAFDIHDPKPYLDDPEFLIMMLSCLLTLCLSTLLLNLPLLKLFWSMVDFLPHPLRPAAFSWVSAFEYARLLFSPPLNAIFLRI